MKKIYKISDNSKRIIAMITLVFQMRFLGLISNTFNKSAVKEYHEIVSSFSEYLKNKEIEDPQLIYEYYNYAMWNGYFSQEHKLQYSFDRKIFLDNAGMSIMSGNGVCLNYADMLSLIFKEMGLNSYVINCYVNPDNFDVTPIRTDKEIKRNIDKNDDKEQNKFIEFISENKFIDFVLEEIITKISGNHAITCVENNGELYFFDPTNFIYLNKIGINDLSIINGKGNIDIKYLSNLLFENINILKIIPYTNENGYNEKIIEKELLNINIEELEQFYNKQKENIENVSNNISNYKNFLSMFIYSNIACFTMHIFFKLIKISANKFKDNDIKNIFPKLKEYFNEKNIKTEFEILKNYELLEKELGITDNLLKDILKKTIILIEIIFENKDFYPLMLVNCLNELGYDAKICSAKKYTSKIIKKNIPLIVYSDKENKYIYDYETEELLCINNHILSSIDGKYQYHIDSTEYQKRQIKKNMNKIKIQNKMNNENNILTKEDIKHLRKVKTLRR